MSRGWSKAGRLFTHKTATCKRCGDTECVWVQAKTGRWYLVNHYGVGTREDGFAYRADNFHQCKPAQTQQTPTER